MFSSLLFNHGTTSQHVRRACHRFIHIHSDRMQAPKSKTPHIPLYKEPDKYLLNQTDLNLIITKTRFIAFCDEITSNDSISETNDEIDEECRENGSFVLQLSTDLAHAMYLVDPIWKRYCKQYPPTPQDIECMLNYLNINESWTRGNYFIQRHILDQQLRREIILTPKCWKSICEIGLKAMKHNECIHLIDCAVNRYKSIPRVVAWREIVKVLLIKRAFSKIVEYSPFIAQHVVDNKDRGLLDMVIHSVEILRRKYKSSSTALLSDVDTNNLLFCIEELYPNDVQRRNHLFSIVLGRSLNAVLHNEEEEKKGDDSATKLTMNVNVPQPNWYVINGVNSVNAVNASNASTNINDTEFDDVSLDFVDEDEQKECELIAFKLNCLEISNRKIHSKSNVNNIDSDGNVFNVMMDSESSSSSNIALISSADSSHHNDDSYLSIFEWMFYVSAPHHFLSLFQSSLLDQLLYPQLKGMDTICAYCLLSIFKCEATNKCGRNIGEFFDAMNRHKSLFQSIDDKYAQFMSYLAEKYSSNRKRKRRLEHRKLKSEIMEFMMRNEIMFWSFGHLQSWLKELLTVNNSDQKNKGFVEFLFNLMVKGMLYHDSFRIRPELRGLLRFGSYHGLAFLPQIILMDETVMEYLKGGLRNYRHPLSPFRFYTEQIRSYEHDVEEAELRAREAEFQERKMKRENAEHEEQAMMVQTEREGKDEDEHFEIADIARQHDFLESLRLLSG